MKAREYALLAEAVEQGVMWGWAHAHKHDPDPSEEIVRDRIEHDVLHEICERFSFDDESEPAAQPSTITVTAPADCTVTITPPATADGSPAGD